MDHTYVWKLRFILFLFLIHIDLGFDMDMDIGRGDMGGRGERGSRDRGFNGPQVSRISIDVCKDYHGSLLSNLNETNY